MPIPLVYDHHAQQIAEEMRRCATAIDHLYRAEGETELDLKEISDRFAVCADILEQGGRTGSVTREQLKSMAENLEGIADVLRGKG